MNEINQKEVLRLFKYKDGRLIRRITVKHNAKKGDVVGCIGGEGYLLVSVDGVLFKVHRLIFLYHKGFLPKYVDHRDNDKLNDRIENLRVCTSSENNMNSKLSKNNTSGVKGVTWHELTKRWSARIMVDYKRLYIGEYNDINDAVKAIRDKREELHGKFANHG